MMKWWLLPFVLLSGTMVPAQDLESLLSDKTETSAKAKNNVLADMLRAVLRRPTPEQNLFLRHIEEAQWLEALVQFKPAFAGDAFGRSEDGQSLKSLLMFRSGLTVAGLETLFQIKNSKKIHFQIASSWKESAPPSHPAWHVAKIDWKDHWTELFGVATEVTVRAPGLAEVKDHKTLKELGQMTKVDSREKALLDWQNAIQLALKDDAKAAAPIISSLMKASSNPVPTDLLNLTAARLLYQNAYFEAAEKYYEKIEKGSDYYLEAQEEKAWTFLRRRQNQDALAVTQSLIHPTFSGQVGPETYFVRALAQLKSCDYPGSLETLKSFPKEFKERTLALEALAKSADTPIVHRVLGEMKKGPVSLVGMSQISKNLPRTLVRDEKLRQLVRTDSVLQNNAQSAEKIFALTLKSSGLQGEFEAMKNAFGQRASQAQSQSLGRVQNLAQREVKEIKDILNKLHIVEAEIIQQVEAAQRLSKNLKGDIEVKKGTTGSKAKDVMVFPYTKEFWFDELTNYKVDIKKACQARRTP